MWIWKQSSTPSSTMIRASRRRSSRRTCATWANVRDSIPLILLHHLPHHHLLLLHPPLPLSPQQSPQQSVAAPRKCRKVSPMERTHLSSRMEQRTQRTQRTQRRERRERRERRKRRKRRKQDHAAVSWCRNQEAAHSTTKLDRQPSEHASSTCRRRDSYTNSLRTRATYTTRTPTHPVHEPREQPVHRRYAIYTLTLFGNVRACHVCVLLFC